jgi:3-phosphoglycerate kinase
MQTRFNHIEQLQADELRGKKVFVRVDFNVPIEAGKVTDDYRIRKNLLTILFLAEKGARIILGSHIEIADAATKKKEAAPSLAPVFARLKELLAQNSFKGSVTFVGVVVGKEVDSAVANLKDGDIVLLENLRINPGEKANDPVFAAQLASLANIYVDDAFSAAHRSHASIVGIPRLLPSYAGIQFGREVAALSQCFDPQRPFLFILGGAKFDTKLPLVDKFLTIADTIFIGGALANDCFKQKGFNIGASSIASTPVDLSHIIASPRVVLPQDLMTVASADASPKEAIVKSPDQIGPNDRMWDEGPLSLSDLERLIASARSILWNGPLGNYELGFTQGTLSLARLVASATKRGATTVVGGGDTLAAISALGIDDEFSFISTAGGAMLDFLAHETLPGIEALSGTMA